MGEVISQKWKKEAKSERRNQKTKSFCPEERKEAKLRKTYLCSHFFFFSTSWLFIYKRFSFPLARKYAVFSTLWIKTLRCGLFTIWLAVKQIFVSHQPKWVVLFASAPQPPTNQPTDRPIETFARSNVFFIQKYVLFF